MSSDSHAAAPESVVSGEMKEPNANAGGAPADSPGHQVSAPTVDVSGGDVGGSSAESDAAEEARKQRIKIGTQRPGVVAPRVEPRTKVAFRTPPIEAGVAAKAPPPPVTSAPTSATSVEPSALSNQSAPTKFEEKQPRRDEPLDLPPPGPPVKFKDKPRKPRFELPSQ